MGGHIVKPVTVSIIILCYVVLCKYKVYKKRAKATASSIWSSYISKVLIISMCIYIKIKLNYS